jgi:hypothetical protein
LHTHVEIAESAGAVGPEQVDDLLAGLYGCTRCCGCTSCRRRRTTSRWIRS